MWGTWEARVSREEQVMAGKTVHPVRTWKGRGGVRIYRWGAKMDVSRSLWLLLFSSVSHSPYPVCSWTFLACSHSSTVLPKWASFLPFPAHGTLHSPTPPPAQDTAEDPELSKPQSLPWKVRVDGQEANCAARSSKATSQIAGICSNWQSPENKFPPVNPEGNRAAEHSHSSVTQGAGQARQFDFLNPNLLTHGLSHLPLFLYLYQYVTVQMRTVNIGMTILIVSINKGKKIPEGFGSSWFYS